LKFVEKGGHGSGLINGGVYLVNVLRLREILSPIDEKKFSLEKDVIEKNLDNMRVYGKIFVQYFIDIG